TSEQLVDLVWLQLTRDLVHDVNEPTPGFGLAPHTLQLTLSLAERLTRLHEHAPHAQLCLHSREQLSHPEWLAQEVGRAHSVVPDGGVFRRLFRNHEYGKVPPPGLSLHHAQRFHAAAV